MLYTDDSRGQLPHIKPDTAGIPITSEEIQHVIKRLPMKKASGHDCVLTEMLVAAGEYVLEQHVVNNHGYFQEELNKYIFITLTKISGTTKCEQMSNTTKLLLCMVMNSGCGRTLQEIAPEQYSVMPDKGTSNSIFLMNVRESN